MSTVEWAVTDAPGHADRVRMKHFLLTIPVEVLVLAFIEFVLVGALGAVLWYMFGHHRAIGT